MRKGQKHSLDSIEKMRKAHQGCISWMKGKRHSEKTKRKISESRRGKCLGNEFAKGNKPNKTSFKKGSVPWNRNPIKIYCEFCKNEIYPRDRLSRRYCSSECKDLDRRGKRVSPNTEFKKGMTPWNKGLTGEKSHSYKNGSSFEPYAVEFNRELREEIKKRDDYTCQLCGMSEKESRKKDTLKRGLTVHHIDYDKKNNSRENLVTLCKTCNSRVNWKREYWTSFFREILCL